VATGHHVIFAIEENINLMDSNPKREASHAAGGPICKDNQQGGFRKEFSWRIGIKWPWLAGDRCGAVPCPQTEDASIRGQVGYEHPDGYAVSRLYHFKYRV